LMRFLDVCCNPVAARSEIRRAIDVLTGDF
jgi:hypothetical protein